MKNWIPISVIVLFVSGFVAWFVSDYVNKPLFWQIWAGLTLGGFALAALIGFTSQKR